MEKLYSIFGLTSSHNISKDNTFKKGELACYKSDICYGDAHSFMADILRHEYKLSNTRGERQFSCAIVDEVDSMLIDSHNQKTLLPAPFAGMRDINKILRLLWDEL